jgi:hypothetical protein
MLASERSVPPNQIGRSRIRSLTTMRYWWRFLIDNSSIPMTFGPGVPTRRSCSRM